MSRIRSAICKTHQSVDLMTAASACSNLDYDYISFQSLGLTQSNLMDLYLLSRSVVGAEVNFDNSKDSGEGCAVNPSKSS